MFVHSLNRVSTDAAVPAGDMAAGDMAAGDMHAGDMPAGLIDEAGGSDGTLITAERAARIQPQEPGPVAAVPLGAVPMQASAPEPVQLELSCRTGADGYQVIRVTGELDIATAEKAYSYISGVIDGRYISGVIDGRPAPVTVDLSGLTFCDASGLGVLARISRHARKAGRQLRLSSARPSLLKLMRLTGLDGVFPELRPSLRVYPA